jgi:CRISPR/Cas system-associated exonuclease Cas4 (RecB family)
MNLVPCQVNLSTSEKAVGSNEEVDNLYRLAVAGFGCVAVIEVRHEMPITVAMLITI